MDSIHFSGTLGVSASKIDVRLLLMQFEDENHIFFVYSPHLDLTGYGRTLQEAKLAFEDALNDFFDYTVKHNTLQNVLSKLGWSAKQKAKLKLIPSIQSIISKNDYVSEIFDKYQVNTFHKDISLPVTA